MRLAFMGTPDFAVPSLAELIASGHEIVAVYSQPPRPKGRGQKLTPSPVHAFAETMGLPVFTPESMKTPEAIADFQSLDLDAACVVAYGQILKPAIADALEDEDAAGATLDPFTHKLTRRVMADYLDQIDAARLQRLFALNVHAPILCAREAVRRMSTRYNGRGGAIVNVSSLAAKTGSPGEYIDYAATKGALDTFTIGLAKEVAAEGIRVNAVRPGFIYTEMHAKGGEPNRVDRLKSQVPLQRGGQPEEIAAAILWLLSPEASYVTGSILDVAGGR